MNKHSGPQHSHRRVPDTLGSAQMKVLYPRNIGYKDVITGSQRCLAQSKEPAGATGALGAHGFSRDQSLALSGLTETDGGSEGIPRLLQTRDLKAELQL